MGLTKGAIFILAIAIIVVYYQRYGPFRESSILTDHLDKEYDFIVVGGGAAGSVIAARLSEDRDKTVLLLEAGGHYDENPLVHIPSQWLSLQHTGMDWEYFTEPQKYSHLGFKGKRSYWPRGRVLGGSSTINGVHYTRGSRFDFDEWAANGCTGWSYKDVHPYFLKSEDIQIEDLKSSAYHSSGGPVAITGAYASYLTDFYLKGGKEMGYEIVDYNGKDQEGFNKIQMMVRHGVRSGVAIEYLGDTADRTNLHIAIRSFVTKIEIGNDTAEGVYFIQNERKHYVKAKREVIISAGAINSPQLLMLSGIGPKSHLNQLGIDVKADLPVGHNLQDHLIALMPMKINKSISLSKALKESTWSRMQYSLFRGGPLAIGAADGQVFFYIDEKNRGKRWPDIQMVMVSSLLGNHMLLADEFVDGYITEDPDTEGFIVAVSPTRPRSRGVLKLKTGDPFDYPSIDPQYLADPRDVTDFIAGIRFWEKFIETSTIKSLGASVDQFLNFSVCSQHKFRSDGYWECFIRHMAPTTYHPCCTCKMGSLSDPTSVVDPDLRVKGIKRLRVADTSIFPSVTSGNTQAPTVMVAEKISDVIRRIDSVKEIRNTHKLH